jgi:hypothetical protein
VVLAGQTRAGPAMDGMNAAWPTNIAGRLTQH